MKISLVRHPSAYRSRGRIDPPSLLEIVRSSVFPRSSDGRTQIPSMERRASDGCR